MPIYLMYVLLTVILLLIFYLLGPRVNTEHQAKIFEIPNDLDAYLVQQESAFNDVKSGTEKKIFWHNANSKSRTHYALVYLHGFSASRQEVSPLVEQLSKELQANTFLTRLSGHGRSSEAMAEITVNDLLNDTLEAWELGKQLGDRVIVVATSTGATLATWLALQAHTEKLAALILLSPNYALRNKKSEWLLLPWAKTVLPLLEGKTYRFQPDNDGQSRYWTWEYPSIALFPMMGLVDMVRKQDFSKINTPVQVLYSEDDKVVDVDVLKTLYPTFGASNKQMIKISGAQGSKRHILAGDIMTPATTSQVQQHILSFIRNLH